MIGIVLAGGKGSRMKSTDEKLLLKFKEPIILHVAKAMTESKCFSKILFLTSPNSPKTKKILEENNYEIFDTKGLGYAEDLNGVLKSLDDSVFVTSGDLPLLDEEIIKKIVNLYDSSNHWTSILVTKKLLYSLGLSPSVDIEFDNQICSYTGISLINSKQISNLQNIEENYVIMDDKRIGFNVNTKQDYDLLSTT
ncbi:MAG: NTP transferase domain-containing protein [Nitrososphaeria archaeon]|nr:NTP transferase domain-containing protein [Nitrosopumilaceae archaeon]NIP10456.1 NTP transferase domain-containing protein [Nitrosopumilaceae archaeon]NIP90838.1 NTP transferase domain-containing protein [Nitrososphaeria archaeon]NIS95099.1 NTP transferase domain-containing protein [Nitrosopumilaceae archaeon]